MTCGPRLVKGGKVWLSPLSEGFKDSHVVGVGSRTAIGFPAGASHFGNQYKYSDNCQAKLMA
ncbi:hypothetical protein QUB05_32075 [Microcoleus sp. F10-C6]|uniref:hypothetical protein n=1 Tax=unclassified Microcoleus TaxID=2642155 RepID=UPI002FD12EB9